MSLAAAVMGLIFGACTLGAPAWAHSLEERFGAAEMARLRLDTLPGTPFLDTLLGEFGTGIPLGDEDISARGGYGKTYLKREFWRIKESFPGKWLSGLELSQILTWKYFEQAARIPKNRYFSHSMKLVILSKVASRWRFTQGTWDAPCAGWDPSELNEVSYLEDVLYRILAAHPELDPKELRLGNVYEFATQVNDKDLVNQISAVLGLGNLLLALELKVQRLLSYTGRGAGLPEPAMRTLRQGPQGGASSPAEA